MRFPHITFERSKKEFDSSERLHHADSPAISANFSYVTFQSKSCRPSLTHRSKERPKTEPNSKSPC